MKRIALVVMIAAAAMMMVSGCGKPVSEEGKTAKKDVAKKLDIKKADKVKKPGERPLTDGVVYKVPAPKASPVKGGANAMVTLVEFSEFQCPFCSRVIPTLDKLVEEYGDKVRVMFRHNPLPFHKNALPATLASEAVRKQAGVKAFWKMHNMLFEKQKEWSRLAGDELTAKFLEFAEACGAADGSMIKDFMKNVPADVQAQLDADKKDAATFGARGTPSFFVNGKKFVGAQPYERFKQLIDQEIAAAAKHKGAADIYAEIVKNGKTKAEAPKPKKPRALDETQYKVEIPKGTWAKGAKNPKVVLIEFSDFQCPFCSRINPTIKKIMETWPNDVAIYFAHNPLSFHKAAMPTAVATMAAGEQGKFWEMHDKVFATQRAWGKLEGDAMTAQMVAYAKEVGVKNIAKFEKELKNPERLQKTIKEQQAYGMKFGARGTPAVFVNGIKISGARPFDDFKKIIDKQLAKANELLKKGVKQADLYKEAIKNGKLKAEAPKRNQRPQEDPNKVYKFAKADYANAPMKGSKNAPVTILEFSEFQCPFCGRVEPTMNKLMEEYKGKIAVYWMDFPLGFHKNAKIASIAAHAAKEQKKDKAFWNMHKKLFETQKEWSRASTDEAKAKFVGYAKEMGLNTKKFEAALNNEAAYEDMFKKTSGIGAKNGIRGTPGFFINGKKLVGAQPYEKFKAAVDAALKK